MTQQSSGSLLQAPFWNRKAFTHLHWSSLVIHAEELKIHLDTNLCTPLK
jgi:hypothetical protein